jgi:hypothetical protein
MLCPCKRKADLEDSEISEGKINPARTPVVGNIILWAQDKKDEKWDMIFNRPSGSLGERSVVTD